MPSIFSRFKPKNPKVFSKAVGVVKKFGGKKNKKELVVSTVPVVLAHPGKEEYEEENSIQLTSSMMLTENAAVQLSAVYEESFEEKAMEEVQARIKSEDIGEISKEDFDESDDEEESTLERPASPIAIVEETPSMIAHEESIEAKEEVRIVEEKVENIIVKDTTVDEDEIAVKIEEEIVEKPAVVAKKEERISGAGGSVFSIVEGSDVPDVPAVDFQPKFSSTNVETVSKIRDRFERKIKENKPSPLRAYVAARNNRTPSSKLAEEQVPTTPTTMKDNIDAETPTVLYAGTPTVVIETPTQLYFPTPVQEAPKPVAETPVAPVVEEVKPKATLSKPVVSLDTADLQTEMLKIAAKPYKEQAVWFLNAFWNALFKENTRNTERVWAFTHKFIELDNAGAKGCELDELRTHRVLEVLHEALTITEMRTKFHNRAKHVSLSELLIFVFGVNWEEMVTAPQGAEAAIEQMQQAETLMEKSTAALSESQTQAKAAAKAEEDARETAKLALISKQQAADSEVKAKQRQVQASSSADESTKTAQDAAIASQKAADAAEIARVAQEETEKHATQSAKAETDARLGEEQATIAENKAVENEKKAREAESEAFRGEEVARESEKKALEAERILIDGQARVEMALNKVKEEEAAFQAHLAGLQAKSNDESLGLVARRTASHEREVLLAKDPEPLMRARIAEEAVVRKHEKLIKSAVSARESAGKSRIEAEKSRDVAVKSRGFAENARSEAAIRRSAAETKVAVAAEARKLSDEARERATQTLAEAKATQEASVRALELAEQAKESAKKALEIAENSRKEAAESLSLAEQNEVKALQAQKLAEESREKAETSVQECVVAFQKAQSFIERVKKQASSGQGGWWWASREFEESKKFMPQKMLKQLEL